MNAAAHALNQVAFGRRSMATVILTKQFCALTLLIVFILFSALSVVYVKDLNRRLFIELQSQQKTRDSLHIEWGKLLLEESSWATQARVQRIAQQQLDMELPKAKKIKMVQV